MSNPDVQQPRPAVATATPPQRVTVVDLDVSFGQLVVLMIKASLAAIPALIILAVIGALCSAVLGGIFAALFHAAG